MGQHPPPDSLTFQVLAGNYDAFAIADLNDSALLAVSSALNAGGWYVEPQRIYSHEEIDKANELFPELSELRSRAEQEDTVQDPDA